MIRSTFAYVFVFERYPPRLLTAILAVVRLQLEVRRDVWNMNRRRATSNPQLGEPEYHDILQRWLKMFPAATFTSLLGPYVSLEREVTPSALVRAADLLKMFVQGGCDECCLRGACLETALVRLLSLRPNLAQADQTKEFELTRAHLCYQHLQRVTAKLSSPLHAVCVCFALALNKCNTIIRSCEF